MVETIQTRERDCPWLLLLVIKKQTMKGNCLRFMLKGNVTSEGVRSKQEMITLNPKLGPSRKKYNIIENYRGEQKLILLE